MAVRRIVANLSAASPARGDAFYRDVLGLEVVMDLGFVRTYGATASQTCQVSIASEGGSGTPVPDLSVEVDNLDEALERAIAGGFAIEYGPVVEPWGVRRFYVQDGLGRLVNVLSHLSPSG